MNTISVSNNFYNYRHSNRVDKTLSAMADGEYVESPMITLDRLDFQLARFIDELLSSGDINNANIANDVYSTGESIIKDYEHISDPESVITKFANEAYNYLHCNWEVA